MYQKRQAPTQAMPSSSSNAGNSKAIYRTGLFAPNREGVKSLGSVQVKQDVVIPAGSYLNLYEVDADKRTSEKSPIFTLAVTQGKLGGNK